MLTTSFTPTQADHDAIDAHLLKQFWKTWHRQWVLHLIVCIGVICGVIGSLDVFAFRLSHRSAFAHDLRTSGLILSVGFFLLLLWIYVRQAFLRKLIAALPRRKVVPMELQMSAAKLVVVRPDTTTTFEWCGIERVETVDDRLLFYTAPGEALFVPRSAFGSAEAFQDFGRRAAEWHGRGTLARTGPIA
jgi:hypothetical protein